jgi:hypothetical protein
MEKRFVIWGLSSLLNLLAKLKVRWSDLAVK